MPKYVIQPSAAPFVHDGQPAFAGDTIELTEAQAERKLARGDLKLVESKPLGKTHSAKAEKAEKTE